MHAEGSTLAPMRVLVPGSEGKDIRRWQLFLMGQGLAPPAVSGAFDEPTVQATRAKRCSASSPGSPARRLTLRRFAARRR